MRPSLLGYSLFRLRTAARLNQIEADSETMHGLPSRFRRIGKLPKRPMTAAMVNQPFEMLRIDEKLRRACR
jgi:hypothetical protein